MRRAELVAPVAAILAALALSALLLLLLGANPVDALGALVKGAFGDRLALENTLVRMAPLLLIGAGISIAFRCGVWNIGGEGQLYAGALVATWVATRLLPGAEAVLLVPLVLLAGAAAGALWGGIAAGLRVGRGVSEVLSTILLNFIAVLGVAWAVHGPLQELSGAYPQSDTFPAAARLPMLPGSLRVHAGVLLAMVLPVAIWILLFRSAAGLRLRAVGLSPEASRYAGIYPLRETVRVLLISGGLAGLAGAVEVSGVTGRLFENLSPGYGFTGIAVALLARLHPLGVLPAALLFAALASGSGAMQRIAGVPAVTVQVIEAFVIFFSVGFALPRRNG
ncbi:MAG: ABC transporter permease [Myxococcales bacterium]|nr:ABC transporter permease [Myxococcales bacterium]